MSSDCLRRGGGCVASITARSAAVSVIAGRPRRSAAHASASAAFGMEITPGRAASRRWRSAPGVAACARPPACSAGDCEQPPALPDRRIGHDRHAALAAPRQQVELDAAAARGCRAPGWWRSARRRHATAPPCRRRRSWTRPSARILPAARSASNASTVSASGDGCRASAAGRGRCGRCRSRFRLRSQAAGTPLRAGVVRIDLADQEHLVAPPGDRLADHLLGAALAVHLGGVDQRHAEVDARAAAPPTSGPRRRRLSPMCQVPWPSARHLVPSGSRTVRISARSSAMRSRRRKLPPQSAAISLPAVAAAHQFGGDVRALARRRASR